MSNLEIALLRRYLSTAKSFLEFGCGGSTILAAELVKGPVISVESSIDWVEKVQDDCKKLDLPQQPRFLGVDIGPVGNWGYPTDPDSRERWPSYYRDVWKLPEALTVDLFLIDGRFRVACAMEILQRSKPEALFMIHDFSSRERYQIISEVAEKVEQADELAVFKKKSDQDLSRIAAILDAKAYDAE